MQDALARLEALVGLWDTATTTWMAPGDRALEADGSVDKRWVLGGRYLREDLAGVGPDGTPLMGLGFLGYDAEGGAYEGVWMSTGTGGLTTHVGHVDAEGRIAFEGVEPAPGGGRRRFRAVLAIHSRDRHVLTQSLADASGVFQPAFEIVYTRAESE